jgi:hypothetical protein
MKKINVVEQNIKCRIIYHRDFLKLLGIKDLWSEDIKTVYFESGKVYIETYVNEKIKNETN